MFSFQCIDVGMFSFQCIDVSMFSFQCIDDSMFSFQCIDVGMFSFQCIDDKYVLILVYRLQSVLISVYIFFSFVGVYIENLTEYIVHSPKEVLNLLKIGKRRLVFAETKMNRVSSRLV